MTTIVPKMFIYLSEVVGHYVVDAQHHRVGILSDITMKMNGEIYPSASKLIVKRGLFQKEFAQVDIEQVAKIDGGKIELKITRDQIAYQKGRIKSDFTLSRDILDQQIVDTNNQKVLRVNDVHLLRVDNHLYLAHVDVGLRGLVRRLEWTDFVDEIVKFFLPHAAYLTKEDLISWKNTHALNLGRTKGLLRLDVARQKLFSMPPTELAEIIKDLDVFEKFSLFKSLDGALQRRVFEDLPTSQQEDLIDRLDEQEAANILQDIPADEAADILLKLPKPKTLQLMKLMEPKVARKLWPLLGFSKHSAGGLMTMEYLTLPQGAKARDAMQKIKDSADKPVNAFHIYIVDDKNHFLGSTSLRRFINADPETPIMQVMHPQKICVRTDDTMEAVALLLEKNKFSAVPVVDDEDILRGVVTTDDVLEELIAMAWKKYRKKLK